MIRLKILSCLVFLHGVIGSVHGADKYTDENRPYEFGFNIEGEQHRHEKKDENGIIMGEFGFITADGVYHVTVYATDENGRFKILSMKNIRVKPYPTAGGGVKKGHSIPFAPSQNAPALQGPSSSKTSSPQQESNPVQINKQISAPTKSCSHCSLPTTTTKAPPPQLTDIALVSKDRPPNNLNNYQQNTSLLSSNGQYSLGQHKTNSGKSTSTSYTGEHISPSSPGFGQNNQNYPEINTQQDTFAGIQQNNQQSISSNLNSPSSAPNLNYPQYNNNLNYPQQNRSPHIPQNNQYYNENENIASQNNAQGGNYSPQNNPPNNNNGEQYYTQKQDYLSSSNPQKEIYADQYYPQQQGNNAQSGPNAGSGQNSLYTTETSKDSLRNPKQYNDISTSNVGARLPQGFKAALESQAPQPVSNRPTLLAAQMQFVPKDTNIHHRNPGEEEGLPRGVSKDDVTQLLYTFNYTVGFHGHHEEGYKNGAKKGYYFVTGRNGVRTRVDYVADEKGFRPKISQEVLDLLSDDVPKPETEKDEKFGLKGYEFKWLYYPTNERK